MNKAHKFKQTEIGLIPEDWEVKTLPDVSENCDKNRVPLSSAQRNKRKGKFPYYGAAGIIDWIDEYKYDGEYLLVAEDGTITSNGKNPMLQLPKGKFWVSNHAHVLKFTNTKELKYIYYSLRNINIVPYITGAVQPKLSQTNLNKIQFPYSQNDNERYSIAKILSDLDSKIELLQKQNKTLEKIGQAIFKHWFVDFEFPNEEGKPYKSSGGKMVESELGDIPDGWGVGKLGDFVESVSGCSYTSKGLENSEKALVTLKSISVNGFTQEGFKEYTGDYKDKHVVKDGDIVVAHTDLTQNRIILGKPAVVRDLGKYEVMIASMDLSIVRPIKLLNRPYLFYLLSTHMFHSHAQGYSNGTTVIHLSRKAVPEFPFIIPSEEILNNFKEFSNYFFDKISINQKSIKSLEKTRDLLLPKLMTGKIRVPLEASQ